MKKLFTLLISLLLLSVFTVNIHANEIKVIDVPDYLTIEEEQEITDLCNEFILKTNMDCVVYIAYQFDKNVQALADDYFDYNGYGIGEDYDGLIFCVDYGTREYTISTCGSKTIDTFTDYAQEEYMYSYIGSYLSDGDLVNACKTFVRQAYYVYSNYDYFHTSNNNYNYQDNTPMSVIERIRVSTIFGGIGSLIVSLVYLLIKKGQLKTTAKKYEAHQYLKDTDMDYLRNGEIYLYTNTHRRKIERDNDSHHSSHSSTHISSSGRSHGGTGGHKF